MEPRAFRLWSWSRNPRGPSQLRAPVRTPPAHAAQPIRSATSRSDVLADRRTPRPAPCSVREAAGAILDAGGSHVKAVRLKARTSRPRPTRPAASREASGRVAAPRCRGQRAGARGRRRPHSTWPRPERHRGGRSSAVPGSLAAVAFCPASGPVSMVSESPDPRNPWA